MSLREQAEKDLEITLEDSISGFGTSISLNDGVNPIETVNGQYHRIGQEIDPDTGAIVSGNHSAATVRLSSLVNVIVRKNIRVKCYDITGAEVNARVDSVEKDRTIGFVTMILRVN